MDELRLKEKTLMEWKVKDEPTGEEKKTTQAGIITELENVVHLLKDKINVTALVPAGQPAGSTNTVVTQYTRTSKQALLAQYVAQVGQLIVPNLDRWISEMDRIHTLEIKEDTEFEEDFVKMVKRQLPPNIFTQLSESGTEAKTWTALRTYLVSNFGSKISVFQHLTKLHDLQLRKGENVSTFASKLEEQLYSASLHIMKAFKSNNNNTTEMSSQHVFKLFGAMLLSVQLRNTHPTVYRSMVKNMDRHWSATSLAAESQDYLDRLGPGVPENQTFMAQPKFKRENKQKTSSDMDNKNPKLEKGLQRLKEKVKHEICRQFSTEGKCKYGERCFRRHVKQSFCTTLPKEKDGLPSFDQFKPPKAPTKEVFMVQPQAHGNAAYVNCEIKNETMCFHTMGLIDSGSMITIVPSIILDPNQIQNLKPTKMEVIGVEQSKVKFLGILKADITLGLSCQFTDMELYVSDKPNIPILLGNDLLSHPSVTKYSMNFNDQSLTMEMVDGQTHKIALMRRDGHAYTVEVASSESSNQFVKSASNQSAVANTVLINRNAQNSEDTSNHSKKPVKPDEEDTSTENVSNLSTLSKRKELEQMGVQFPQKWDQSELDRVIEVVFKNKKVLGTDDEPMGTYTKEVRIPTKEGESFAVQGNHVPQALEKAVDEDINRMLRQGIIEKCDDPKGWNSPVFAVLKGDGKSVRTVCNFKPTLNRALIHLDPYEMPSIEKIFTKIGTGNKYFAKLDLKRGYWQIPIHPDDRHKTAHQWKGMTLQYAFLSMGLTSAGNLFSRAISQALEPVSQKESISCYIDDHLVHARTFEEYLQALDELLTNLAKFGLKLNPKKCDFISREQEFLGRIVGEDGYRPNPTYCEGIQSLQPPQNKRELKSLIGRITWIRQFLETKLHEPVKGSTFADIMKPIHDLTKETPGKKNEIWSKEADRALRRVKRKLSSNPVIQFADFSLPFNLTTDASTVAAGAILTQTTPEGKYRIIGVSSKTFSPTEQRWSATEREAFAIKWGIEKFSYFLFGRPFVVFCDHKSLQYLDQKRFNNAKINRWQDALSQYKFVVQYLEGEQNVVADMLSRPNGLTKEKGTEDSRPAGKYFKISPQSDLKVYVPSWALEELSDSDKDTISLIPDSQKIEERKDACCFFTTGRQERVNDIHPELLSGEYHLLASKQEDDYYLKPLITYLKRKGYGKEVNIDDYLPKGDSTTKIYKELLDNLYLEAGTNMLLLKRDDGASQYVVPESDRVSFLHRAHDMCNHVGITRTDHNLSQFYWPGKYDDIRSYCNSCEACARRKGNYGRQPKWSTGHVRRGTKPFEVLMLDYVHMPVCKGKQYILSIICCFSKFYMAIPCKHADAVTAAKGLVKVFYTHRVIPKIVSSDRGSHFTGEVYRAFNEIMGIQQDLHVPWRPQSSGNVERAHRTLKNALYIMTNETGELWPDLLEAVVSNMNACPNKATGVSPHYVVTGRQPSLRLPQPDEGVQHPDPKTYGMQISAKLIEIAKAVETASEEADKALEKRTDTRESPQLSPGDKCYLYRPQSAEAKRSHNDWIGPFTVNKSNGMILNILDSDGRDQWVHRFHVRVVPERPQHLVTQVVPVAVPKTGDTIEESGLPEDWSTDPIHEADGEQECVQTDNNISVDVPQPPVVAEINNQPIQSRRRSRIPEPTNRSRFGRQRRAPKRYDDYIRT